MSNAETLDYELALWEVTAADVQAVEHFADAVLRDDFFFRKGHWLSLVADSRVQLFVARLRFVEKEQWSEIVGLVVLYADSVLHNLFLSPQWRSLGLGSAIIEAVSPEKIRAKVDMSSGDPSGFYARLGYTHESDRKGKRGQIRVLTKLRSDKGLSPSVSTQATESVNPEPPAGDDVNPSVRRRRRS